MHNMAKTSNITPILSPKLKLGNLLPSAISNPISFSDFLISTSTQTGDLLSTSTSFHHIYTQTDNHNCVTMPIYTTTGCQSDTQHDNNTPILRNALPLPFHPPFPISMHQMHMIVNR